MTNGFVSKQLRSRYVLVCALERRSFAPTNVSGARRFAPDRPFCPGTCRAAWSPLSSITALELTGCLQDLNAPGKIWSLQMTWAGIREFIKSTNEYWYIQIYKLLTVLQKAHCKPSQSDTCTNPTAPPPTVPLPPLLPSFHHET